MRRVLVGIVLAIVVTAGILLSDNPSEETVRIGTAAAGDEVKVRSVGSPQWKARVDGPDPIHDHEGSLRSTTRIHWSGPEEAVWWVAADGTIIATGSHEARSGPFPESRLVPGVEEEFLSREWIMGPGEPACLWRPFDAWLEEGACAMTPNATAQSEARKAQIDGAGLHLVGRDMVVWPIGAAYPARVEAGEETWEIASMTAGRHAAWSHAAGHAAPLRLAAPSPWGLDEERAGSLFLASEAYQAAMESTSWPDFRAWAETHPDHIMVNRTWFRGFWIDHEERRWTMVFVASGDSFGLRVTKDVPGSTLAEVPPAVDALAQYRFEAFRPSGPLPERDALPTHWPTQASATDRWRSVSSPMFADLDASAVAFSWRCTTECSQEDLRLSAHYWDGRQSIVAGLQAGGGWYSNWAQSVVHMDGEGQFSSRSEWIHDVYTLDDPAPATQPEAGPIVHQPPIGEVHVARATAIGAAAGVLFWALAGLRHGALFPLFSRIRDDSLLDHPVRRGICDAVESEPGIRFEQLRRRLEVSNGSLHHHVERLARSGHVRVERSRTATHCFPSRLPAQLAAVLPVAREPSRRAILCRLHDGAATPSNLNETLGLSRSMTYEHIKRLKEAGLVIQSTEGIALSGLGRRVIGHLVT